MLTTPPEKTHLRLGFMPLNDCAPLIVAERLQLGAAYGLTLELARQSSWAAIRDKLLSGELDAAHDQRAARHRKDTRQCLDIRTFG